MSATLEMRRGGFLTTVARAREVGLFAVLAALLLATTMVNPRFLGAQGIKDILEDVTVTALLCIGETIVLLMRQVDLSVSSVLGITAYATGTIFAAHPGAPIALVMLVGAAVGAALGALNAALVAFGGVPSLVATLGTLYVFRGAEFAWVKGGQINATSLPKDFLALATSGIGPVPYVALIVMALIALAGYFLRHYPGGREYYAVGSNEEAARLAGIDVPRRLTLGFLSCGAFAGFAGALFTARFGTVDATAGTGMELHVIAACVVGGVAITGGVGSVEGAAIGALLLAVISNALVSLRVPVFWEQTIEGALLLVAISLDLVISRRTLAFIRSGRAHG